MKRSPLNRPICPGCGTDRSRSEMREMMRPYGYWRCACGWEGERRPQTLAELLDAPPDASFNDVDLPAFTRTVRRLLEEAK